MKFKESKKVINFLAYFLEEIINVLVYRRHELSRKSLKNEILAICVFCNALWFFTNFS